MRLLLVEDDRRIAADVGRALRAAGYVVETVGNGEEAWFRGDTEDYGAIVLDLGLPGMIAIVEPDKVDQVIEVFTDAGETVAQLGTVIPAEGEHRVVYNGHLDLAL